MMMMAWGAFIFTLDTIAYQQLARSSSWRHAENTRVGYRPGYQYLGQGEETINLSATLLPELTGGRFWVEAIRGIADTGVAFPLIERTGKIWGNYVLQSVEDGHSLFFDDGQPRKIEVALGFKRIGDDQLDLIGSITDLIPFG